MALNIKNPHVESLAAEVARLTGESKTEAIRRAPESRRAGVQKFLENEVWPLVPPSEIGRRLSRSEKDAILGYGPDGV